MLLSELEERERNFKLALRAGIPVLLLVFLVFYSLFVQEGTFKPTLLNVSLIAGIVFITIYFNYFLIEKSVKETVVDSATQSFNEKAFIEKLEAYKPKTLVLLVVKNLYAINENYNTSKVDFLLYTIIHRLNKALAAHGIKNPLIARRFGAEFLIALDQSDSNVKEIFETFIKDNHVLTDIEVDYAFSAITDTQGDIVQVVGRLRDLLSSSDDQKGTIPNIQDAKALSQTEQNILEALDHKQFKLTFRPLLNAQNNTVEIYEIVAKLLGGDQKEILPRIYLPIINRLELGITYDLALVEHILKLMPLIDARIAFTFNLSPFSLRNKVFQEKFFLLLDRYQVDSSRIIIQLYERKTHHDLSGYFKTLNTFRAKGIRICIDNFGSSNASMEYMKHFKFDMVQFDRDYTTNLSEASNTAMLSSLITMSKALHVLTVAKWVDKETQKLKLKQLGIDYLQGFGIGKPLQEEQLINEYN